MERGDIALIPASCMHYAISPPDKLITLGIYGSRIDSKTEYDLYRDIRELIEAKETRLYKSFSGIAERIVRVATEPHEGSSPYPAIEMIFVIKDLAKKNYIFATEGGINGHFGSNERDRTRFLVIEHIISHYAEPYCPEKLAEKLYITRRHLDRIVREHYGKTLREIIYEKRIEHAKHLLLDTDCAIEKIALRIGFSSAQSFKNAFLGIEGMTPREYRLSKTVKQICDV